MRFWRECATSACPVGRAHSLSFSCNKHAMQARYLPLPTYHTHLHPHRHCDPCAHRHPESDPDLVSFSCKKHASMHLYFILILNHPLCDPGVHCHPNPDPNHNPDDPDLFMQELKQACRLLYTHPCFHHHHHSHLFYQLCETCALLTTC